LEFWQNPGRITGRLSSGQRRAEMYDYWRPAPHVSHRDMIDRLDQLAARTGDLRCWMCARVLDSGSWHLDHVRPLVALGRHDVRNLMPACWLCNLVKGDSWDDLWEPPLDDFMPLWERLKARPIEDVWDENPELARRALTVPRPVPVDEGIGEFAKADLVVRVLRNQPDSFRAMKFGAIYTAAPAAGGRIGGGELTREWLKLLGMSNLHGNPRVARQRFHDRRLPPHPQLVPTRVRERRGTWGVRGFRLRPPGIRSEDQELLAYGDHDE
jgi:hypothetical protein